MKEKLLTLLIAVLSLLNATAQKAKPVLAGPMPAHTELRTAKVWVLFRKDITSASLFFNEKNKSGVRQQTEILQLKGGESNTALFTLAPLEPGRTYKYYISIKNEKQYADSGEVTTQSLWQWRSPAPDFNFITGSCAYFNEPVYDRPGKPYGGDSSIFLTMAKEKSSFMLWLGDNWYTRETDFYSEWGLYYRARRDRSLPVLQPLLKAMPHYAIWDDHDYGPDNGEKSYVLKTATRNVFADYWGNPSCGLDGQGIYSQFTWNDVDFFLLDDRWFRSSDEMPDSVNGMPNKDKKMFGDKQMEWLKNRLLSSAHNSNISFRVIITGSQVLNPYAPGDCLRHYPAEYTELTNFIADSKINGLLFITGDRHHSEIIKVDRSNAYPLFDITCSPLTSGVAKTRGAEANNPARVSKETDEQNYGRISFTGAGKDRQLSVKFIGIHGEELDSWSVRLKDVSY